jgi:hypothetical protein
MPHRELWHVIGFLGVLAACGQSCARVESGRHDASAPAAVEDTARVTKAARPIQVAAEGPSAPVTMTRRAEGSHADKEQVSEIAAGLTDPAAIDVTQVTGQLDLPHWSGAQMHLTWTWEDAGGNLTCRALVAPAPEAGAWELQELSVDGVSLPGKRVVGFRRGVLLQLEGPELSAVATHGVLDAVRSLHFTVTAVPEGTYAGGAVYAVAGSSYAVGAVTPAGIRLVSIQDPRSAEGRRTTYPAEAGQSDEVAVQVSAGRVVRVTRLHVVPDNDAPGLRQRLVLTPVSP